MRVEPISVFGKSRTGFPKLGNPAVPQTELPTEDPTGRDRADVPSGTASVPLTLF
jgi:hypothetical protein